MKITRFRKYISWNIISFLGYFCGVITVIFYILLMLASSGTTIRADINQYFYEHMWKNIIIPYFEFYKFQIFLILVCFISSIFEHRYYRKNEQYGLRIFGNHEKMYSAVFVTGIFLNLLPLYIFIAIAIRWIMRIT